MRLSTSARHVLASALAIGIATNGSGAFADVDTPIVEIVVTTERRALPALDHAGNIDRLGAEALIQIRHQHPHELFNRVAGVWLSRGSGQESLTAIRSPVLTGAGSCGAFLTLEDGIPSRPAGFCNVNQLFELNTEQAEAVEVIRGPGSALYGSNALHGIVNVVMPDPGQPAVDRLTLEFGANDFYRLRATFPYETDSAWRGAFLLTDDGGFRDDAGYRQAKGHVKYRTRVFDGDLVAAVSLSDLNQETAGFIVGPDAYKDASLNRSNPNPEAFRDASTQRVYGLWSRRFGTFDADLRPYFRRSDMTFLQHFLPGQPLEENGHVSAGILSALTFDTAVGHVVAGVDIEWSDVFLKETQDGETQGSEFLRQTRPAGKHYDFDVSSAAIAPYVQAEFRVAPRLNLSAGLRAEVIRYAYDNRMSDGNARDDGTACGFGGCLYTRPADRSDRYVNVAPKFAARFALSPNASIYANLARGFRAPQVTELYRLQSGQVVADLDSETIDSAEVGLRTLLRNGSTDVSLFTMRKRDSVFRDSEGFNVSGARSTHRGIEVDVKWRFHKFWQLGVVSSYSRHVYDFDRVALRGETFVSGRDVDTAPRWLASAELFFVPNERFDASLQWTTIGPYYLDAENLFEYPGHRLANFRARFELSRQLALTARLNNVFDADIADRADYAFGNFRYFPGRGREAFVEVTWSASSR